MDMQNARKGAIPSSRNPSPLPAEPGAPAHSQREERLGGVFQNRRAA
jgi:hypothetical protein